MKPENVRCVSRFRPYYRSQLQSFDLYHVNVHLGSSLLLLEIDLMIAEIETSYHTPCKNAIFLSTVKMDKLLSMVAI